MPKDCFVAWHVLYLLLVRGVLVRECFFRLVFAFKSTRSFHAVRSAPVNTSSLAAANRMCVWPILPQPPGIGREISGASSTNAACCSGASIRLPYPSAREASEANFLPPTRKAGSHAWEYSSTPSRLSAIVRKSAGFMALGSPKHRAAAYP